MFVIEQYYVLVDIASPIELVKHAMSRLEKDAHTWCVRVTLAVQRLAQYAILCSTAQHPCVLQHNATTCITHIPSVVLAELRGKLCGNFGIIWLYR